ncbi:SusC/RagA family TonB-linked outer membrane protein [Mucilaginibacter sp. OK098]|uniref:SusC/RagA family TonB-linked outer membrane protein n=1 Tax=Mucilaginibacter sp. OK098 TaxID=1855297 RepID=UPI00091459E1|nr:TonB-dependent receptor [Mucilaginibacter sp. OK098]SHM77340.1 iron complex outermembrane recepter protein [Mucilaginibacter sp. OK098]
MITIRRKLFMTRYLFGILLMLLFFCFSNASAQSGVVKGTVKDTKGSPLPGVTVQVKGTNKSTSTSVDGNFSINADKGSVLLFRFIGFKPFDATVGDAGHIDVTLTESQTALNDVVVVGYGTASKRQLTSAITTVKAENFNAGVVASPADLLEGKVAGLNITNDGNPNGQATVTLRGPSTLRAGAASSPFYVIDDVPDADINLIAPSDILSMDVLKDASASAIYGSRATNGVIIVTTKKAKAGQLRMSYDAYAGIEKIANQFQVASAAQLKTFLAANGQSLTPANNNGTTDWEKEIERNQGFSQNHNLSFGGGTDKSVFGGSINYLENQGIVKTSGLNRFIGRLNLSQKALNNKLKLDFSLSNSITSQNLFVNDIPLYSANGANPNVFRSAIQALPTRSVYNADGTFYNDPTLVLGYNPLGLLETNTYKQKVNLLLANAKAELKLPFGFQYNLNVAYQDRNTTNNIYLNSASELAQNLGGVATRSQNEDTKKLFENYLSYEHTWNNAHNFKALFGYSFDQTETGDGFQSSNENFVSDATSYHNLALGTAPAGYVANYGNFLDETLRLVSFYSRLNYSYLGKYILQASIRRDGSNAFGTNNQWGYFPAVSGAWRISDESFMKSQTLFDDLKLRVGYGKTGNALGFDPYTPLTQYGTTGTFYYNGQWIGAIGPTQNPNPNLKWETTATLNAGVDFSLLGGRLSGSVDVYNKKTTDMIYSIPVSTVTNLVGNLTANVGSMSNKGVEISLNGTPVKGTDFTWDSYGNISFNKNRITSLGNNISQIFAGDPEGPGQSGIKVSIIKAGYPLGEFYTLKYIGMTNGVSTYLGANGKPTTSPTSADQTYAGNAQPTYTFGWGNTLNYKKFSFNFFFRGQGGNKIMDASLANFNTPSSASTHNVPLITLSEPSTDVNANKYSTRYLESGTFVRLSNATLSYRLKVQGNYIHGLRLYATATNLFVITKYKGVDPELNLTLNNQASGQFIGVDSNNFYPKTRTFLAGVQVDL